jgi:hypothetical protein
VELVCATKGEDDGCAETINVYYILVDANGTMTTSDGRLKIHIRELDGIVNSAWTFYNINVRASDFKKATIGTGATKREVILHKIDRLPFSSESLTSPENVGRNWRIFVTPRGNLTLNLTFTTPDGRELMCTGTTFYQ